MKFKLIEAPLEGLKVIEVQAFGDQRGYFMETYNQKDFKELGIDVEFVQDNQASSRQGTLRGLHFQMKHPQAKLVRVLEGRVYDVAVDLRKSSPTYGRYHGVILDAETRRQFFVPAGFAHGYLVLSERAEFAYKCSDFYHPEDEGGLLWDDPEIGIDWPLEGVGQPILSDKDRNWPALKNLEFSYP